VNDYASPSTQGTHSPDRLSLRPTNLSVWQQSSSHLRAAGRAREVLDPARAKFKATRGQAAHSLAPASLIQMCAFAQKLHPSRTTQTWRPAKARTGTRQRGRTMKNLKKIAVFCLLTFAAAAMANARVL
jgi:hypothetical protein